jgi:citrate lyase beta subunit
MKIENTDRVRRSLLFTPANRPSAFDKALESGADCVCLDLEDSVPPSEKDDVRSRAIAFLSGTGHQPELVLRINALSTRFGLDDLSAVATAAPAKGSILLPKVANAGEVCLAATILEEAGSDMSVSALIESAEGLARVEEIACSTNRLSFLLFGAVDLSADLGCSMISETIRHAASRTIQAARFGNVDVLDVPELAFRDIDQVGKSASLARDMGFTGKAAIHPSNIEPINQAFTPDKDEIAEAERIVAIYESSPNGLAVLDGRLIEAPVIRTMRRRLAIADAMKA